MTAVQIVRALAVLTTIAGALAPPARAETQAQAQYQAQYQLQSQSPAPEQAAAGMLPFTMDHRSAMRAPSPVDVSFQAVGRPLQRGSPLQALPSRSPATP